MIMLEAKKLSVSFGGYDILKNLDFVLEEGQWLMIAGPNGCGKSTTLGAISGSVPYFGDILLRGKNIREFKIKELAKYIGVLLQSHMVGYSFSVGEVVRLGRYAYSSGIFSSSSVDDEIHIESALELTGLTDKVNQSVLTLSGGELQRTFLAQLFAQEPEILILDEPTNHLDLVYQKEIFAVIQKWLKKPGRAVISVVHDLSLAKKYGSHCLLFRGMYDAVQGKTQDVFTPRNLKKAYSMDVFGWMNDLYGQWKQE